MSAETEENIAFEKAVVAYEKYIRHRGAEESGAVYKFYDNDKEHECLMNYLKM